MKISRSVNIVILFALLLISGNTGFAGVSDYDQPRVFADSLSQAPESGVLSASVDRAAATSGGWEGMPVYGVLAMLVLVLTLRLRQRNKAILDQKARYSGLQEEFDEIKELYMIYRSRLKSYERDFRLRNARSKAVKEEEAASAKLSAGDRERKSIPGELFLGQMTVGISREIEDPLSRIYNGVETLRVTMTELIDEVRRAGLGQGDTEGEPSGQKTAGGYFNQSINELTNDASELMERISSSAAQTRGVLRKLGAFNSLKDDEPQPMNVNQCVDDVILMLNDRLGDHIEIRRYYDDTMKDIQASYGSLHHVFINLLLNAIQAVEEKGEGVISVYTENREDEVIVRIHDNGVGISDDVKPRIFEPFFTTRQNSNASGLGLSICYGVIKESNGDIIVRSTEGEGTEIEVIFPVTVKAQKIC